MLSQSAVADPTLTLMPLDGAITGTSGATVGWGFTISNSTNFLVVTSSDFCVGPIASPCGNGLGTYSDFIGPNFIIVGPPPESTTVAQAFNLSLSTGLGSFLINPGSTPGQGVTGQVVVTYDLYSVDPNDPNFNPGLDTISVGNLLTANASVTAAVVPEPTSLLMLGSGLAGTSYFLRRKRPGESAA